MTFLSEISSREEEIKVETKRKCLDRVVLDDSQFEKRRITFGAKEKRLMLSMDVRLGQAPFPAVNFAGTSRLIKVLRL